MIWYIFGAITCLIVDLFVWLTCWFWGGIAAVFNLDKLPRPFDLLHTHDDDIYGSATTGDPRPDTVVKRWKRATWWMLRNPAYGFQAKIFGIPAVQVFDITTVGKSLEKGLYDSFLLVNDGHAFGYRRDLIWSKSRYLKMRFGWHDKPKSGYHLLKLDFHPYKKVSDR